MKLLDILAKCLEFYVHNDIKPDSDIGYGIKVDWIYIVRLYLIA